MHACIHTYIHACIQVYKPTYIHINTHTHTHKLPFKRREQEKPSSYSDYVTSWITKKSCFDSRQGQNVLLFTRKSKYSQGPTKLCIQRLIAALSPGRRRASPGDDSLNPSSSQFNMRGTIPPLPQYLYGVQRNTFTLTFTIHKLSYNFLNM